MSLFQFTEIANSCGIIRANLRLIIVIKMFVKALELVMSYFELLKVLSSTVIKKITEFRNVVSSTV